MQTSDNYSDMSLNEIFWLGMGLNNEFFYWMDGSNINYLVKTLNNREVFYMSEPRTGRIVAYRNASRWQEIHDKGFEFSVICQYESMLVILHSS